MISPFATREPEIYAAFMLVMAETSIAQPMQQSLLEAFIPAHQSGDPRQEVRALKPLLDAEWDWQNYDEWETAFRQSGIWPYMWKREGYPDPDNRDKARLAIFGHYLTRKILVSGKCDPSKLWYFRQYGWRIPSINCEVEDRIAAELKATVDLEVWETWPPFFPGDRSSIVGGLPNSR